MGKINNDDLYSRDEPLNNNDKVIGSDFNNGGATKNFYLGDIKNFVLDGTIASQNLFTVVGEYELVGNTLTIFSGWEWRINGIDYTNAGDITINIPFAATGLLRLDLIAATTETFVRKAGDESPTTPVAPTPDPNTIQAFLVFANDGELSIPIGPIEGGNYIEKLEKQATKASGTGEIYLNYTDVKAFYDISGDVDVIRGANIAPEVSQYDNKKFAIRNLQLTEVIIKHNDPVGTHAFLFPDAIDYVLEPNEVIEFYLRGNALDYIGRNPSAADTVNLSYVPSPTDGTVTNTAGTDATIPLADFVNAGLLSPGEKLLIQTALQPDDQYTDEMAQDAVGNILTDSTTINFAYNDGANQITASIAADSITDDELANNINVSTFVNDGDGTAPYATTDIFTVTEDGIVPAPGVLANKLLQDDATWVTPNDVVAGGQLAQFTWKFQTNITPGDPGNGFFRVNNATPSLITELYIDDITSNNQIDISGLFAAIKGNWLIYIQQRNDASKWIQFTTSTAYTDNTGWWTIPVTYVQSGAGGGIDSNTDCLFVFFNKNVLTNDDVVDDAIVDGVTDVAPSQNAVFDALATKVDKTQTININGVIQNLSANRQWRAGLSNTGALTYGGATVASGTTINIGAVTGIISDNETVPGTPDYVLVNYVGATNVTVPTIAGGTGTYVLLAKGVVTAGVGAGALVFQNTPPTSAQRKTHIYLSKVSHPNLTSISFVLDDVDFVTSPLQQFRDLFQAIQYMKIGITPTGNAGLTINTSNGEIVGDGINFVVDRTTPNNIAVAAGAPRDFLLLNQSGATGSFVTTIDPANYDVGGVTTLVGGGTQRSTIQYLYFAPGVGFAIQRGQTVYTTLLDAIAAVGRESFTVRPNLVNNSILVAAICIRHTTTAMNDPAFVRIFVADKFGQIGGAAAGVSVTTLQTAYNNSIIPHIVTSLAGGALTVRRGSSADTDAVIQVQNGAGTTTWQVDGNGKATGTSFVKTGGTSTQFLMADGSVKTANASKSIICYYSTWNMQTADVWRSWTRNTSNMLDADAANLGVSTASLTLSNFLDMNFMPVGSATALSKVQINVRESAGTGGGTLELLIAKADLNQNGGTARGTETNYQVIVQQQFTQSAFSASLHKDNFPISAHTLNPGSVLFIAYRQVGAAGGIMQGVQLTLEFV